MPEVPDISTMVEVLISSAYPELQKSNMTVSWGKTSSFAQIQWGGSKNEISIRVNTNVKTWHEAGIIGLISHELSHPAQRGVGLSELKTDKDAISRGFGPYLAVERLFAGKYEDHVIQRGKDKYFGYRSIRTQLTHLESQQLDIVLSECGLVPTKHPSPVMMSHDIAMFDEESKITLTVEGRQFLLPQGIQNPDIKLVERNSITYVYADEILVGEIIEEET
ncbi:MAG: hypothetical protein KGD60_09185 [Candidatus Thorarchaeota archaeon]|nr:hypothetical protein [Candidatus Thorarchaeota archaeon]